MFKQKYDGVKSLDKNVWSSYARIYPSWYLQDEFSSSRLNFHVEM